MYQAFFVAVLLLLPTLALADDDDAACTQAPQSQWLAEDKIKELLAVQGYQDIRSVEPEGTCYEVYAKNAQGEKVELYVDPTTAAVVKASED